MFGKENTSQRLENARRFFRRREEEVGVLIPSFAKLEEGKMPVISITVAFH